MGQKAKTDRRKPGFGWPGGKKCGGYGGVGLGAVEDKMARVGGGTFGEMSGGGGFGQKTKTERRRLNFGCTIANSGGMLCREVLRCWG